VSGLCLVFFKIFEMSAVKPFDMVNGVAS